MGLVVHGVAIIFALFRIALVQRRIFFRAEQDGVVVEPLELIDAPLEFGHMPGFAARGVHQPELHMRRVWFGLRQRPAAEECDRLAGR